MYGTRYRKSLANNGARKPHGIPLQCARFNTVATAPCKGVKPKLWGFHKASNSKPSLCIVRDANGRTKRIVKSIKVR